MHQRARLAVPDLDRVVVRARHDVLPVEGHREDGTLVAGERVHQRARLAVPDLDRVVPRARHDVLRVKGHRVDVTLVAGELAEPADQTSARAASLRLSLFMFVFQGVEDGLLQDRRAPLLDKSRAGGGHRRRIDIGARGGGCGGGHSLSPLFWRDDQMARVALWRVIFSIFRKIWTII